MAGMTVPSGMPKKVPETGPPEVLLMMVNVSPGNGLNPRDALSTALPRVTLPLTTKLSY